MRVTYSDAHGFIVTYNDGTTEYVQRKRVRRSDCVAMWRPKRREDWR